MCSLKRQKGNGSWNWCEHMAPQIIWASRCEPEMRALTPPAICFRHLHFPHLSYHPIYFQWLGQIKNHPISNIDIFSKYWKLNCPISDPISESKSKNSISVELCIFQVLFRDFLFKYEVACQTAPPPLLCVDWLVDISCDKHSLEVGAGLPPLNCVLMEHLSCQGPSLRWGNT